MTTRFYAPPHHIVGNRLALSDEDAHHAVRVLRHRPGDLIEVVDGDGGWYRVRLEEVGRQGVSGSILARRQEVGEPRRPVIVGMATLKNTNRFETFVEKAVELGVTRIVPLRTERTERVRVKDSRLERIVLAAMKQCGRSRLTQIAEPTSWEEFVASFPTAHRFVCHEAARSAPTLLDALSGAEAASIVVAVGPEGGFSEEEIKAGLAAGFQTVGLGTRRLRAETAAITAAACVMLASDRSSTIDDRT